METSTWEKATTLENPYRNNGTSENTPSIVRSKEGVDAGYDAPSPVTPNSSYAPEDEDKERASDATFPASRPSVEIGAPIVVSRSKRRGLCGRFTLLAEVEDPKAYPRRTKWFLTFVVAFAGSAAPMGSSIFFPSLSQVTSDLNTTPTITNISVAVYMLSMSIFPLWWSSFSEALGRRTIYLASFSLVMVFNILAAISQTIGMLIVMRLLSGGAAASVQAVGAGTIADLWEPRERGRAMTTFYLGPLCGPLFAPIIGGALANRWGWRSTLWFMVIFGGVALMFIFLALPETLILKEQVIEPNQMNLPGCSLSRVSSHQVVQGTAKRLKVMKMAFLDPLKITLYLRFPAVLLTVCYASITFGALYVMNISIQETFGRPPYNFSTLIIGLLYIPNSLGYLIASLFGGRWMDNIMQREARKANRYDEKGRLIYRPEDRMGENAWLGTLLYPTALIWYGWAAQHGVYWIVPMISGFFFGIGSMLIFGMATTMLTEFMPKKSSSGVALNNFMRNIFSCIGCIVAAPIIQAIGNGWLFTIIGLVSIIASSLVILAMRVYGPRWRLAMDAQLN